MPIINLTVDGKRTIKDSDSIDTKIVCLNKDYQVHITLKNCDTFVGLEYKKLVVKYGMEYSETTLVKTTVDGKDVYTADMPAVKNTKNVEIGVCGRTTEGSLTEPVFTSTPAVFDCEKSVLCGAIVQDTDAKLGTLDATENKTYHAYEENVDGFSTVNVRVGSKTSEEKTVYSNELNFNNTRQEYVVTPKSSNHTMSKVIIQKPAGLIPSNIPRGTVIAGIAGTHEPKIKHGVKLESNGTYPIPENYDGYGEIVVNVKNAESGETPTAVLTLTGDDIIKYDGQQIPLTGYGFLEIKLDEYVGGL